MVSSSTFTKVLKKENHEVSRIGISRQPRVFFYETWQSREALGKHLANARRIHFRKAADGLLEKPMEVFLLDKL